MRQVGIVIEKPGDHVGVAGAGRETAGNHFAGRVGTHDDRGSDILTRPERLELFANASPEHAHASHQHDRGAPVEQDHTAANPRNVGPAGREHQAVGGCEHQHCQRARPHEAREVAKCHSPPRHVAETREIKDRHLRQHDAGNRAQIDLEPRFLNREIVSREPREKVGRCEQQGVYEGKPDHSPIDPAERDW